MFFGRKFSSIKSFDRYINNERKIYGFVKVCTQAEDMNLIEKNVYLLISVLVCLIAKQNFHAETQKLLSVSFFLMCRPQSIWDLENNNIEKTTTTDNDILYIFRLCTQPIGCLSRYCYCSLTHLELVIHG